MQTAVLDYAPNVSWLFPELPFKERPGAIARLGFTAIEFGFPSHADLDALKSARDNFGLQIVLFNQDVPVWDQNNRGYLVDPHRRDEFRRKLDESLDIAGRLEALKIMLPAGVEVPGLNRLAMQDCIVENLRYAAPLAGDAGVSLNIEVLNPTDNPGYFLTSSQQAIQIVQQVDHPQVRFQFDTYHLGMMEGDLDQTITAFSPWIGHIQFADFPGRHEPGTGSLNFDHLISVIQKSTYKGYIGLEYIPQASGKSALDWIPQSLRASRESRSKGVV